MSNFENLRSSEARTTSWDRTAEFFQDSQSCHYTVVLAKPLDQNIYTTWCCASFTGPLSICLVPRGHRCAGSARGREAPEIQDTAGTARGLPKDPMMAP